MQREEIRQYEWEPAESPSVAVVGAFATVTGEDPTELAPLTNYIDADALDELLQSSAENRRPDIRVTFRYEGAEITVDGSSDIIVIRTF